MGSKPAEKAKKAAEEKKAKETKETKEAKASAGETVKSREKETTKHRKHHASTAPREEKRCKMKSCKRSYKAKGYCRVHYRKWRHGEFGRSRYKTCHDVSCLKPMVLNRHGYCEEHYQSYYVKGMEVTKAVAEKPAEKAPAAAAG